MTSILILENQEPGDCATCPLFFRNAGVCSWTMRFDGACPTSTSSAKGSSAWTFTQLSTRAEGTPRAPGIFRQYSTGKTTATGSSP